MKTLKRALRILNWKQGTKGMDNKQKVIATLYYPIIAIIWWTYFMWSDTYN